MSDKLTRERAIALHAATMLAGSWDKTFARNMAHIARCETAKFTEKQVANIERLAWKYRRQIPDRLIPEKAQ